jgi:hypothetical protein
VSDALPNSDRDASSSIARTPARSQPAKRSATAITASSIASYGAPSTRSTAAARLSSKWIDMP